MNGRAATTHVVFAVIAVVLLFPFLSGFTSKVVGDDTLEVNYPHLVFEKAAIAAGHFPFWNPYAQAGTPDFACPFYDFFYPLHWLIFLFPIEMGINVLFVVHGVIGWIGAFLFFTTFASRRAAQVAAWLFILSTPMLQFPQGGYLGTYYSVVAMPWCLYLVHRAVMDERPWWRMAWATTAGILFALGMSVIASYAIIFNFLPASLYLLFASGSIGRRASVLIAFGLAGSLVCAVRLWPWFLLTLETHRTISAADLAFSSAGSVHPLYLLNYLFPNALPPLHTTGLAVRGYGAMPWPIAFGLAPILLIGRSLWRLAYGKFFIALYLAALVMVFGVYSPVFLFCFYFLPGFSVTTHPNIYTWIAAFAACGMIAHVLSAAAPEQIRLRRIVAMLGVCAAVAAVCLYLLPIEAKLLDHFLEHREGFSPASVAQKASSLWREHALKDAIAPASALAGKIRWGRVAWSAAWIAMVWAAFRFMPVERRIPAFAALLALDLLTHPVPAWQMTRPSDYYVSTPIHEKLLSLANASGSEPFRVYPVGGPYNTPFFKFNQGCVHRVESIKGETGFLLRDAGRYFNRIQGWPLSVKKRYAQFYGTMFRTDSRLLDLLNVKYMISDTPLADHDLALTDSVSGLFLYENRRALPHAFVSRRIERVDSIEEIFSRIERDTYDPREVLYTTDPLPAAAEGRATSLGDTDLIKNIGVSRWGPNKLNVGGPGLAGGWLCVAEPLVPGWTATAQGIFSLAPIKVNGLFQAYWIPPKIQAVSVSYAPRGLGMGLIATVAGTLLWVGCWIMAFRKRNKEPNAC